MSLFVKLPHRGFPCLMTDPRMPLGTTQLMPVNRSMVGCPRTGVELSQLKPGALQIGNWMSLQFGSRFPLCPVGGVTRLGTQDAPKTQAIDFHRTQLAQTAPMEESNCLSGSEEDLTEEQKNFPFPAKSEVIYLPSDDCRIGGVR